MKYIDEKIISTMMKTKENIQMSPLSDMGHQFHVIL